MIVVVPWCAMLVPHCDAPAKCFSTRVGRTGRMSTALAAGHLATVEGAPEGGGVWQMEVFGAGSGYLSIFAHSLDLSFNLFRVRNSSETCKFQSCSSRDFGKGVDKSRGRREGLAQGEPAQGIFL